MATDPRGAADCRSAAEERAAALRLPLVWPERFPEAGARRDARRRPTRPSRAAARAFVLAAARLAFCGGFDLDDPRSWPRRPPPRASAGRTACTPRGDARPRRRDRGGGPRACWRRAPTGCRRCASGARCSGASSASATPRRAVRAVGRRRSRAGGSGRRYGLTSPARICASIASTVSGLTRRPRISARGSGPRGRTRAAAGRGPRRTCGSSAAVIGVVHASGS